MYKKKYKEPSTLIRFSSTVEDTCGCPYVMDELDETFLNKYNSEHTTLSEDDFEKIMYQFESITKDKLPHLHLVSLKKKKKTYYYKCTALIYILIYIY